MTQRDLPTEVRAASDADWPAIEAGYAHSFLDCRPPRVWHWRYGRHLSGPAQWRGSIVVDKEGAALGFVGGSLHRGWVLGREQPFVIGRDNFRHPSASAGLGARQSAFARAEIDFHEICSAEACLSVGFGLDRRSRLGALLGTTLPYESGHWWSAEFGTPIENTAASIRAIPTDFRGPEWDHFWRVRRRRIRMGLVRDSTFLSWRFDERQGRNYWRFAIYSWCSDTPAGYVVLTSAPSGQAVLVDAALPEDIAGARAAFGQIESWLAARGITRLLAFSGPGCPEHKLWPGLGLRPCESPLAARALYRMYSPREGNLDFNRDYAFTLADSDLY
jgi:hypothetical protein